MGMSVAIWINAFSPDQILTFPIGDNTGVERVFSQQRGDSGAILVDTCFADPCEEHIYGMLASQAWRLSNAF